MIRFPCQCGHQFQEPDTAVGVAVQCPRCLLLSDVPAVSAVDEIGLGDAASDPAHASAPYSLDEAPSATSDANDDTPPLILQDSNDPDGQTSDIPLVYRSQPPDIPFAKRAITYPANDVLRPYGLPQVLIDLFQPTNLFVLFCVLLFHCLALALFAGIAVRLLFVVPVVLMLVIAILAHYGNVIEEIGIEAQDELPRLMRDLRLHEDFLWPLGRVVFTLALAFGPAVAVLYLPIVKSDARTAAIVLAVLGVFFFPAIALTLQASGSLANLRPLRVLGVVAVTHVRYLGIVLMFAAAMTIYVIAVLSLSSEMLSQIGVNVPLITGKLVISLPLLCIAIYLMHAFCWQLALLYRSHGARFPWISPYAALERRAPLVRRKPQYFRPGPVVAKAEHKVS
ncbi:MAG TPA: hypothetical protein VFE47_01680 [Tepidisphaeraceae bacterium]|jgi:hypothetical protein|nr:hypothetical protein [Tepidisphaeraceae bacterium]